MAESEEELKSHLMKVKKYEKLGLKLSIRNTKIMASSLITSWQIDGKTIQTMRNLFSWVPKLLQILTVAMKLKNACSLEKEL